MPSEIFPCMYTQGPAVKQLLEPLDVLQEPVSLSPRHKI